MLLQKTASEVQCEKRHIFLMVHFGKWANGGPVARYATATYSNTATRALHCNKLPSINLLFHKIFNKFIHTAIRVATETSKSNSRTFLGHFPGLFQDCLRFFFTGF